MGLQDLNLGPGDAILGLCPFALLRIHLRNFPLWALHSHPASMHPSEGQEHPVHLVPGSWLLALISAMAWEEKLGGQEHWEVDPRHAATSLP